MSTSKMRAAVLLSGHGTTLQNLIDEIAENRLPITIDLVISNRPQAFGLERARRAGIATKIVLAEQNDERSAQIFSELRLRSIELVLLAGWLKLLIVPPDFMGKVLNIHPSLLPDFGGPGMYGKHVHEAVLAAGRQISGCTVHYVDNEYDHGPILLQRSVDISSCRTAEEIAALVAACERNVYPEAIRLAVAKANQG